MLFFSRLDHQPIRTPIARALALFIGGFTLLNLLGNLLAPRFDANHWWVDFRPGAITQLLLLVLAILLLAFALRPRMSQRRRILTAAAIAPTAAAVLVNLVGYYILLARAQITSAALLPFSIFPLLALAFLLWTILARPNDNRPARRHTLILLLALGGCLLAFPLLQMYCFGKTDYRRPADAILVFGARAYADGRPSQALADRVRTACDLYHQGLAPTMIFSGGPGDGAFSEPQAMLRMATSLGVPPEACILDEKGLNTAATARNTPALFPDNPSPRILAVSHFYHLPRIKLTYQRLGLQVYTVPAREPYILSSYPYLIAREIAGLWAYYLRPLAA